MAKEIYIDENGNENLVSGTINTAEMLPIESGSATNTKDYIDTGLSGKQDSIKIDTVSQTTNSLGFCNINLIGRTIVVLAAWSSSGDVLIVPFSASSATEKGTGQWWFRVHNDSMQIRANYNFTMYYAYIETT